MDRRHALAGACAVLLATATGFRPAAAHHGWRWTSGEIMELTGTIAEVSLGMPHGELVLDVEGEAWRVEVGQPWRNERAGLRDGDLAEGVRLTVFGEPAVDPDDRRIKAVRLVIGDREFNLYPDRS